MDRWTGNSVEVSGRLIGDDGDGFALRDLPRNSLQPSASKRAIPRPYERRRSSAASSAVVIGFLSG